MRKNILLVDDDESLSEALQTLLTEEGYRVNVLSNGNDITEVIKKNTPDLILLDYRLPGENGIEITRRLKRLSLSKKIPIIIVSASANLFNSAKEAGASAFLPKPFNIGELLSTIQIHLG